MDNVNTFLAHHGVKGMRWGHITKKDGGGSDKASVPTSFKAVNPAELKKREAKAQKFEEKAATLTKQKADFEKKLAKTPKADIFTRSSYNQAIADHTKAIETAKKDADLARQGRMSSGQKKALIGAAVVGGLVLAYGAHNMAQSGQFNSMATRGRAYVTKSDSLFKKNPKLADPHLSADDIMKNVIPGINPDHPSFGTNMNCRRATFAYEMRRRGLEVEATKTTNASGQTIYGVIQATTPGLNSTSKASQNLAKMRQFSEAPAGGTNRISQHGIATGKSVFHALDRQPERSRGEFVAMWNSPVPGIPGGGHSMAYEVINGKAHIFDTQSGEEYKAGHEIFSRIASAGFTRLDNMELNETYLSKWVK